MIFNYDVSDLKSALNSAHFYFNISELSLSDTPTLETILTAMPYGSVGFFTGSDINMSSMTDGSNVTNVIIFKIQTARIFALGMRSYLSTTDAQSRFFYATFNANSNTFLGWFEVARKDALDTLSSTVSTLSENVTEISGEISKNNLTGVTVDFTTGSYTDSSPYTALGDGYLFLSNNTGQTGEFRIYGSGQTQAYIRLGLVAGRFSMFVRKGMKISLYGTSATARFVQLS